MLNSDYFWDSVDLIVLKKLIIFISVRSAGFGNRLQLCKLGRKSHWEICNAEEISCVDCADSAAAACCVSGIMGFQIFSKWRSSISSLPHSSQNCSTVDLNLKFSLSLNISFRIFFQQFLTDIRTYRMFRYSYKCVSTYTVPHLLFKWPQIDVTLHVGEKPHYFGCYKSDASAR